MITNERDIHLYYPLYDAVQNKGYLTLVPYSCIDIFSIINTIGIETLSMFDKMAEIEIIDSHVIFILLKL